MTLNRMLDAWAVIEGKTNSMMARDMGIDQSYVWLLRHGQRPITDAVRWKFAKAYGYEVALKVLGAPEPAR